MKNSQAEDLPQWLWLWLPLAVALFPYILRIINPDTDSFVFGERGIIENITVLMLLAAIVIGFKALLKFKSFQFSVFKIWLVILMLGCFYYAGEELSWGQHLIGWETPDGWKDVNDQGETNLHNTSALLDQFPRTMLTLAAVVGGILVPLFFIMRGIHLDKKSFSYWLWPTYVNIPTCLLAIGVSLHEKSYKLFDSEVPYLLDIRAGELKECMLAIFLLMYIASFYKRMISVRGD